MRTRFIVLITCTVFLSSTASAQHLARGLEFAMDFHALPYFKKGTQTYQYSSTDPAEDQFNDFSHWLYTDKDSAAVLADIKGPGTIYRLWSTGNVGDTDRLKMYIDGEAVPRINETFNSFHSHRPLRDKPQVGSGAGDNYLAWWSYMPIPFSKSIKIVREGNFRPFYNITYHTYADTSGVRSWKGGEDYQAMEQMWNAPGKDPKPIQGNVVSHTEQVIGPAKSATIFEHEGGGYIASIKISNYPAAKQFRIRMYWDGESIPSVDAPLKWFFGSVDNGGDVKALGVGTVNKEGYCYFPMPFWKNARIELVNLSAETTAGMNIEIQYNKMLYPANASGYFHAKANETDKPGKKYECLKTSGRGHVIGMAKRMPAGGHACEGDEIFYIDGRKYPDIYGTGEEDYANCAWWKNTYNSYPTHGAIGNDCYYRIHYPDMIIYENGIDMEFESWQNYYIASLVWYYEKDKPSLVLTDSLDVRDRLSEKRHAYRIVGQSWEGDKTGKYPGKRIYDDSLQDGGRRFSGASEFTVRTDKKNTGVRLRVRTDNRNFQGVSVFVDGKKVEERDWIISKNAFDALWVDADFDIPEKYTRGKSSARIRLQRVKEYKEWSEYRYDIFSCLE